MKKIEALAMFFLWSPPATAQIAPAWVSNDSAIIILKGSGAGWTFGGGSWSFAGQTWLQSGMVNSPPADSAWAQLDLGSFAGKFKYIYVMWHKNGPYRPHATHFEILDSNGLMYKTVVDETKHANGLGLQNDTFSGWYLLGDKKVEITPTTKLRTFKDSSATSVEYLQSDAIMLSDYPVIDNASSGSVDNFEYMNALSVPGLSGVGYHWGLQGLSEQFTLTPGDSATTQLDSSIYSDASTGDYYVDISWVYYNADSMNVINANYAVDGNPLSDTINQNRSATNQNGPFIGGDLVGTWSGFYRLSGSYYFSPSHPLRVSTHNSNTNNIYSLVWNMIRFVPRAGATNVKEETQSLPAGYELFQNYPNPFNPTTEITYNIVQNSFVSLKVYNILGQEIAPLVHQYQKAGSYTITFNAEKFESGVYFYRIQTGGFSLTKKMLVIK